MAKWLQLQCLDSGRTVLSVRTEETSERLAFPRELVIDLRVDTAPPERIWVAAALCLDQSMLGHWRGDFPLTRRTAAAIARYLGSDDIFFEKMSDDAYQWAAGATELLIDTTDGPVPPRIGRSGVKSPVLQIRRLGDWTGRLYSIDTVITSSNAYLFNMTLPPGRTMGAYLAVGVLVAADLFVDHLIVPIDNVRDLDWENRACRLCAEVGIDVEFAATNALDQPAGSRA